MGMEPWMSRAPAQIVVAVREDDYHDRYREPDKLTDEGEEMVWPVPYWYIDAGAAVMLLWLAALDEGLACGVFGTHAWDELRELLHIPPDVTPVAVLTIGKEGKDTVQGSAKRGWKPLEDVVRWERW
jgi:nitroreductase